MDATKLLTADHQKVRDLLDQLAKTTARGVKSRSELLKKIATELKVHTKIEEEIFYPAFKQACKAAECDKMYFEALEEHRAVGELVIPDLERTDVASEKFSGRAKVLKELVEHHADEEEQEMFKRARKVFAKADLERLGEELAARKQELLGAADG